MEAESRGRPPARWSGGARRGRLGAGALLLRAGARPRRERRGPGWAESGGALPGRVRPGDRAQGARVRAVPAPRQRVEAAELARWLAFLHGAVHGNMAAANGWMARAESLLEGVEECAAHGWLTLDRAPWSRDAPSASGSPRRRSRSPGASVTRDLEFGSLALLGDAYVHSGRVAEGMTLLDEAMAAVTGGEVVGIAPVGEIYCRLLSACERAADVEARGAVDGGGRRYVAWGDFVPPTCRLPLRRDPDRDRPLGRGGARAARRDPVVRRRLSRDAPVSAAPPRGAPCPPGTVRGGRAAPGGQRVPPGRQAAPGGDRAGARRPRAGRGARAGWPRGRRSFRSCPRPLLELLVDIQLARDDRPAAAETLDRLAELAGAPGRPRRRVRRVRRGPGARGRGRRASLLPSPAALERFSALDLPLAAAARSSSSPRRSPRELRTRRSPRLVSRSRRSSGSARLGHADAAGDLLRRLGARRGARWPKRPGRSPSGRPRSCRSWPPGARTPRSASASHQPANRRAPRREHPLQAGPAEPRRGGRLRGARAAGRPVAE